MQLQNILADNNANSNVSFTYHVKQNKLEFTDPTFTNLFKLDPVTDGNAVLHLLLKEELPLLKKHFKKLLNGTFKGNVQFRVKANGTEHWLRLTPFILQTAETDIIAANLTDITSEVNNQYTIEKFANKKNSTLTMLAHDLRGPLGVARMISQTMGKTADEASRIAQSENLLKVLKQSIDLINDIIEREVDETVKVDLLKKQIDIATKLKEYMEELRLSEDALKRNIQFSSSPESIYAFVDEGKFMQVINNLLSNALKFTRDGDTISLSVTEKDDKVSFTFSDTGVGIPQKFQNELFDKFTPARRKGLRGEPTIGLGLSIVKTILDWHQGSIRVQSEENKGTTFYFEVPKGEGI